MNLLTGIDLPLQPSCGSLILSHDLYTEWPGPLRFFGITPHHQDLLPDANVLAWPEHPARSAVDRAAYIQDLAQRLKAELGRDPPDVYHMHHLTFGATRAALEVLPPELPVVALCHGTDLLIARRDPSHRETVRRALARANVTVFPTRAMLEEARPWVQGHVEVISWGLPEDAFRPRHAPFQDALRVLYAGRLTANKGAQTVLDALAMRSEWSLTLVGPREGHSDLRVPSNATLRDFMDRRALWALFDTHDVLIVPTREVEAFGLTAVEAAARGLPVVYAQVPGLTEVLGDAGVGYAPGDAKALLRALDDLAPEVMSARGVARAARYQLEETRARLVRVSREVMALR